MARLGGLTSNIVEQVFSHTGCKWRFDDTRRVTRAINRDYNVAGICKEFPQRLADVVGRQGDRLPK